MVLCSDWHERHISFSKVATIALINQKPYERYVSLNMNVTVTDTLHYITLHHFVLWCVGL